MSKQEVDKILGIQNKKQNDMTYDYDGLRVFYRNNKVAAMDISSKKGTLSRFVTSRMLSLGDTIEEVRRIYGQGLESKDGSYICNL